MTLKLAAGEYILFEESVADEASLFASQLAVNIDLGDFAELDMALAYYRYTDLNADGNQEMIADNQGNLLKPSGTEFQNRFEILNPIFAITFKFLGEKVPIVASGEYMYNVRGTRGPRSQEHGWALGLSVGDSRKQWGWRVYYQWQVIEADSIMSAFAQDQLGDASNFRGHQIGVFFRPLDNVRFRFRIYARKRLLSAKVPDRNGYRYRSQIDLDISF